MSEELKKSCRYFETQGKNEEVILVVHKHWSYLAVPFVIGFVLMFLLFYFYYSIRMSDPLNFGDQGIYEALLTVFAMFIFLYMATSWLIRYYNVIILTTEHLVEIEQPALFSRKTSVLDLGHIEDSASSRPGFFATALGYGNVEIQTAGEMRNFLFNHFGRPEELQRKIMAQKDIYLSGNKAAD